MNKNAAHTNRTRRTRCEHYWHYEHAIWAASENLKGGIAVGRYCGKCGKMETATANNWHPLPKSYVCMRATLSKSKHETQS